MNIKHLLSTTVAIIALAMLGPAPAQQDDGYQLKRTRNVAPQYPRRAKAQDIEGWVELQLTVDPDGEVVDVAVLDAEPKQVFERAAIRAVMRWEFEPPREAGITENQVGRVIVNFAID